MITVIAQAMLAGAGFVGSPVASPALTPQWPAAVACPVIERVITVQPDATYYVCVRAQPHVDVPVVSRTVITPDGKVLTRGVAT